MSLWVCGEGCWGVSVCVCNFHVCIILVWVECCSTHTSSVARGQGAECPLTAKKLPKIGEKRGKRGKKSGKEGKTGKGGKIGKKRQKSGRFFYFAPPDRED